MTRTHHIDLHCMRCRMTVRGTIEVDDTGGDEAFLQTASGYDHSKMRCPICGPSYPREKILEVTIGREVVKIKSAAEYRAEAKADRVALQDPSLCPYKAGDEVRVAFSGFSRIGGIEESVQKVVRVTPKGGVRLSDGYLYKRDKAGEYHYWSTPLGNSPLLSHGKILGPA